MGMGVIGVTVMIAKHIGMITIMVMMTTIGMITIMVMMTTIGMIGITIMVMTTIGMMMTTIGMITIIIPGEKTITLGVEATITLGVETKVVGVKVAHGMTIPGVLNTITGMMSMEVEPSEMPLPCFHLLLSPILHCEIETISSKILRD